MSNESTRKEHILAINDDQAILDLFEDLLSEAGYEVSLDNFHRPTSDLVQSIREMQPDLVVLDFLFGGEPKGWQLLQATRMDRAIRDIPVVICTAAARKVEELNGQFASLNIHAVLKPFDIDHLLDVIDLALHSRNASVPGSDASVSSGGD